MRQLIFLTIVASLMHPAVLMKNDDHVARAIEETQAEPVSVKQKLEEIKEGVKGAPSPRMTFYSKTNFLTDDPFEDKPRLADNLNQEFGPTQDDFLTEVDTMAGDEGGFWWEETGSSDDEWTGWGDEKGTKETTTKTQSDSAEGTESTWWTEEASESEEDSFVWG